MLEPAWVSAIAKLVWAISQLIKVLKAKANAKS